ncbi:MAG: sigma-54-dependent Fis family transcriptional regulator [Myxococcaceae bacterium]|jgi:transcriptional regulator with AAA-type ATPase domain|nr:sigma-54-dependent Fis family transcriptional regulator [Myxococcaceae bacterium]
MKPGDLDYPELLELDPDVGLVRFGGHRAVLLDVDSLGTLRQALLAQVGAAQARAVLLQLGYAAGWRSVGVTDQVPSLRTAEGVARLHGLHGFYRLVAGADLLDDGGVSLEASWEADQHLAHLGHADAPCCWVLSGLLSGALSRLAQHRTVAVEDKCRARGDRTCHFVVQRLDAWEAAQRGKLRDEALSAETSYRVPWLVDAEAAMAPLPRPLPSTPITVDGLVTLSPAMRSLVELACRIAPVDSTVLITGESGSGKERIARLVHQRSARAAGPFITVNCGAITETLLESELFGHHRGAFTGATSDRPGLFEAANGGTLFLDEVGEVSAGMQVKLLRAVQQREIRRVGENRNRPVDVRIITATNRDLQKAVDAGTFRQDLYYRLKVIELRVPSLRERREDVLPLARQLLSEAATRMRRPVEGLSPEAAAIVLASPWPGNVRELENVMERAVAVARGQRIEVEDLPTDLQLVPSTPLPTAGTVRHLDDVEREYILAALTANNGNQTRTAEQLHIGSATLYRKLKRYGARKPT